MREIYTINQACQALEVGRRQFQNWRAAAIAAGKLPPGITQFTLAQVQLMAADHRRQIKDIDALADADTTVRAEVQRLGADVDALQSRVAGLEALLSALIHPNRLDLHPVSDSPASLQALTREASSPRPEQRKRSTSPGKQQEP